MLTDKQMERLKKHAKEHGGMGSKHMRKMKKLMEEGMSFAKAHKMAMEEDKERNSKSKPMKGIARSNLKKNKSKY